MRNLRLYVDSSEQPRPTPPPPFSNGAQTPRLVLLGHRARLAPHRERFESPSAPASSSASKKKESAAAAASARVESAQKLRYKLDTGDDDVNGTQNKKATTMFIAAPPPASSQKRPASAATHKTTSSGTIRLPLTSRVMKSSDKYAKLHKQRDAEKAQLNKERRSPSPRATSEHNSNNNNNNRTFAQEAAWYSKFCPNPGSVTYTQGTMKQQQEAREALRAQQQQEEQVREASKFYASAFFGGSGRDRTAVHQPVVGGSTLERERSPDLGHVLEHRALSPAPTAATTHNVLDSRDPSLLNEEQAARLIEQPSPSEEKSSAAAGISLRLSPRSCSSKKKHHDDINEPQPEANLSATSPPPPSSSSRARRPGSAPHQQQQPDYDPVLERSRHLLVEALMTAQDSKRNRHIFSQLHSVSSRALQKAQRRSRKLQSGSGAEEEELEAAEAAASGLVDTPLKPHERKRYMIAVDEGGGPVVAEALDVAGHHMDAPGPRRPHTARTTSRSASASSSSCEARAPPPPPLPEQSSPSAAAASLGRCVPQVPIAYVGGVPGVFCAGLMSTRRRDLHEANLHELAAHKPLHLEMPDGSVPVPGEFSSAAPRGRSDKWQDPRHRGGRLNLL